MMVLTQKRDSLPLWLLLSAVIHLFLLLIPFFPLGKGRDSVAVGEIELVEVGSPGSSSQVEIGGGGLAAPDAIALPQTSVAEVITTRAQAEEEKAISQPATGTEEAFEQELQVAKTAPSSPDSGSQTATSPSAGKPKGEASGKGKGMGESTTSSGTSQGGKGAGGGGGDGGPIAPGTRSIPSTKALMNLMGNPISLFTIVEVKPDGSYTVLQPIQEGSPATSAAKREFSKLGPVLKQHAYHSSYRMKITFIYYPGKGMGKAEFQVLD